MDEIGNVVQNVLEAAQRDFAAAVEGEIKDWMGRGYTLDQLAVEYIDRPAIYKAEGFREYAWTIEQTFRVRTKLEVEEKKNIEAQIHLDHDIETLMIMEEYNRYREVEYGPETSAILAIGHVLVKIFKKLEDIHKTQRGEGI